VLDIAAHCHEFATFSSGPHYAAALAKMFDASLTGLYIAPPIPSSSPADEPPSLLNEFAAYVSDEIERAEHAQQAFIKWAASRGASSSRWQLALGDAPEILAALGNWNDVLVLEYRERAPHDGFRTIGRTLLSGVPCIVVREGTDEHPSWKRIAIAWNGSAEAIRAVHAALPLLRHASQIHLLSAQAPHSSPELDFSIDPYLAHHGLSAMHVDLDESQQPVAPALLLAAANVAADLLIMGAFGTSRFRDAASLGTTRHIIEQGTLPLFLRH